MSPALFTLSDEFRLLTGVLPKPFKRQKVGRTPCAQSFHGKIGRFRNQDSGGGAHGLSRHSSATTEVSRPIFTPFGQHALTSAGTAFSIRRRERHLEFVQQIRETMFRSRTDC